MLKYKITKTSLLRHVCNDACNNYYYEIKARLYVSETHFYRVAFVISFDAFDVQDYFEKDCYTKQDLKIYKDEIAHAFCCDLTAYDESEITQVYDICNKTINGFNQLSWLFYILKRRYCDASPNVANGGCKPSSKTEQGGIYD